jgi:hypothetical protein
MTASKLPPNIQDFNEIAAVLFGMLYSSFPAPTSIFADLVAQALGLEDRQARMSWLLREEFISEGRSLEKLVLTTKGIAALNSLIFLLPPSVDASLVASASSDPSDRLRLGGLAKARHRRTTCGTAR